MNLKIGKLEAIFLVLIVMINKILLNIPKEIIKQSGTGSPVNIIFTSILILIITLLICKLFQKFPNEDIIDISKYVGKKPLQIILGTLLLILFTMIITSVIYEFTTLLQIIYFPNTPISLILLIFLGCMGVANKTGFKSIVKANSVIIPIILLSLVVIFAGILKNLNLNRLYPILGQNVKTTFLEGSQNIFAYGGLLYLFFIVPFLKNKQDFKKVALISMYLLTRCIELGKFLQRTDAIFVFLWIISAFSYLSISLMFMSNIFGKLTECKESRNFSYSFLGIFFSIITLFQNQTFFKLLSTTIYKYSILGILLLCFIILIIGNIKRKEL